MYSYLFVFLLLADYEATEEVPSSSPVPEQEVPVADPEVEASSAGFAATGVKPQAETSSSASSVGKSLLITLPAEHETRKQPAERGESSSGPSLEFAKRVLNSVLSSWVETLSSGHLEAGFGMVKHVQDILAESEGVGLDVAGARAFVDKIIALGNKWAETKSFPDGEFFTEMFLKPSSKVKSEMDEISRTRKQFIRERNVTELAIIELTHDLNRLDGEVVEARQRLELLEEQVSAKWAAVMEARDREGTLIRRVEEAESNLRRKVQEHEQWQVLWEELPRAKDGSRRSAAFYGKLLKKRGLGALEAEAKSLLNELGLWLETM